SIYSLVAAAAPSDRRAAWLAFSVSGLLVSLPLGAAVGAEVGMILGWAWVFVALAALSLLFAQLNCRIWPVERRRADAPKVPSDVLPRAVLLRRLMPTVMWSTSLYGVYTYLGACLISLAFSPGQVARAILCYGCGAIAGALIGGHLADRLGTKL